MTTSSRRSMLRAAFAAALLALPVALLAQDYPARPISIVVGYGAGTAIDVIAREVAGKLSDALGVGVLVENKPGAAGIVSADYVAQARPDGYTLLITSTTGIINEVSSTPRTKMKDFEPVAFAGTVPYALAVPADFPARTVAELIAMAKSKPGQLNYAGLIGGIPQYLGEMFKKEAAVDIVMVPYKSTTDAQVDLVAGRVPLWFTPAASAINLAKGNRLRILATTAEKRLGAAPEVPTMREAGLEALTMEVTFFFLAPAGTPKAVVARLNRDISNVMKDANVTSRLASQGVEVKQGSGEDVTRHIKAELVRWDQVVNAKPRR